jgi:hypothetical protein
MRAAISKGSFPLEPVKCPSDVMANTSPNQGLDGELGIAEIE